MKENTITPAQSRDARRELGLSQADVATELGINRAYLSDFENGHLTRLTRANQRKLREFYEAKAEEARAAGEDIQLTFDEPEHSAAPPVSEVRTVPSDVLIFRAADSVSREVLEATRAEIASNDKRLVDVLTQAVHRNDGFFGDGEFSKETQDALRESFALLAANYLLVRSVTGWPDVGLDAANIGLTNDTVVSTIIHQAKDSFVRAGLVVEADEEEVVQ